ncbi:MAG: zinc ribbon domain-containing protein [Deltaproteobacteria bacterium]|nr:zinc ribbon domain-containing protein [Deltaproteobacteria bacterium]
MPIYEYHCEKCDRILEVNQRISDAPLTTCPSCEDPGSLKKLISRSSFHLKGGGWYTTDYARAGAKDTADAKDSVSTKSESSSETKSDAAPACGQGACAACTADA